MYCIYVHDFSCSPSNAPIGLGRPPRAQVLCGDSNVPTAMAIVRDKLSGTESTLATTGTGPVDAAFKALRQQIPGADNIKVWSLRHVRVRIRVRVCSLRHIKF